MLRDKQEEREPLKGLEVNKMKKEIVKGYVRSKEQLTNSREGGPRCRMVLFLDWPEGRAKDSKPFDAVREITATTATNSSAGYCLSCSMSYLENRLLELEIHETKAGNYIITRIISGYYGD